MNQPPLDPKAVVREILELYGGEDNAWKVFKDKQRTIAVAWNQDTDAIGRILRGHLFVEHFLSEYLSNRNPGLGPMDEARLTFAQKVALVDKGNVSLSYLLPGVRRLNAIRNRLAHTLRAEVTQQDADVLLSVQLFRAMREQSKTPRKASTDPIDILEDFALHAGHMFYSASDPKDSDLWAEALRRAEARAGSDAREHIE
jgi:hypothetical protein